MSVDAEAALGRAALFEFRGVTYTLVPYDVFDLQKAYTVWLKRRAWDELFLAKTSAPAAEHEALTATLQRDLTAGIYNWGGRVWIESLADPVAWRHLVWLNLRLSHRDVSEALVDAMLYDPEKGPELKRLLDGLTSSPNFMRPALMPGS